MNRRDLLKGAVAVAAAAALPSLPAPNVVPPDWQVGDVITIGGSPQAYVITDITTDQVSLLPCGYDLPEGWNRFAHGRRAL